MKNYHDGVPVDKLGAIAPLAACCANYALKNDPLKCRKASRDENPERMKKRQQKDGITKGQQTDSKRIAIGQQKDEFAYLTFVIPFAFLLQSFYNSVLISLNLCELYVISK